MGDLGLAANSKEKNQKLFLQWLQRPYLVVQSAMAVLEEKLALYTSPAISGGKPVASEDAKARGTSFLTTVISCQ